MGVQRVWFAGVPTEPDVAKLKEWFGTPDVGTRIAYDDVAQVIDAVVRSSRWRTVTRHWRAKMRLDHNLFIGCENGTHFVVLNEDERLDVGCNKIVSGAKVVRRGRLIVDSCDDVKLDEIGRHRKKHFLDVGCRMEAVLRDAARNNLLPRPINRPVSGVPRVDD